MEYIEVKVNGKPYQTYIDEHKVQRFVPNRAVERFVDSANEITCGFRELAEGLNLYDLNRLKRDVFKGEISLQEMIDIYTMIGYSVSGFADVFWDYDVEIENPRWADSAV